jgi:hypothetical protein
VPGARAGPESGVRPGNTFRFRDSAAKRARRRTRLLALDSFYQLSRESDEFLEVYVMERIEARTAELGSVEAAYEDLSAVFDIGDGVVGTMPKYRALVRRVDPIVLANGTAILRGRTVRPRLDEVVLDPEVRAHFRALEERARDSVGLFLEACRRKRPRDMVAERYACMSERARTTLRPVLDAFLVAADVAEYADTLFNNAGVLAEQMEAA